MSDNDRAGASLRDYADWNAALNAVERLAGAGSALREPVDEAQLNRDIAEIRKAALALSEPPEPRDAIAGGHARKRRSAWILFGGVWILMAIMTAASIGALLFLLT